MLVYLSNEEYYHFFAGDKTVAYYEKNQIAIHPVSITENEIELELGSGRLLVQKKL